MPKVIENARELIIEETMRQITENGYDATTVRSVAKACGMAVGTVYNYYPSKDIMIASVVMDKWERFMDSVREKITHTITVESVFRVIYTDCSSFIRDLKPLFSDTDALSAYAITHAVEHHKARRDLADLILPGLAALKTENQDFTALYIAESILGFAIEDVPFESVWSIVHRLL